MREIEELLKSGKKYKNAILQEKFKSKKNTVAYVILNEKPRIIKWFVPGLNRQMNNEYNILKKGSGKLNIPTIFEKDEDNNVLIMNYIIGENLCDIINDDKTSFDEKKRLLILLADWFFNFHNYFKKEDQFRIRGDCNLRNFILTDKIWGLDFEESRTGRVVEDIAGLCSSILSTDPMFISEKFKLCKTFIESYTKLAPGRILKVNNEIAYALLEKIQWRPDQEEILRKFSKKIREEGLFLNKTIKREQLM
jgi:tRNA A-37 threonylcarbamoyl transferase component Bud32